VNQKTWHDHVAMLDPPLLRWMRRAAMTLLALSLCWGVLYSLQKNWHPWPPLVGIIAALDFLFAVRAVTLMWRSARGREIYVKAHRTFMLSQQQRIR
jgi:xanthosine utilization system XapX-like protein